jgi:3-methyl-2-oxobutanoate hydroxymethyltransferase
MSVQKEVKKITTNTLQKMKSNGEKISMITAYDFSFAKIFDSAGIDVILVGDSASNVMAGHETTLPITLDQIIYHASSVIRGIDRCLVVVDIPFGYYQSNSDIALASAVRIMKETGAHAVKLEGGEEVLDSVRRIISAGVPVMGHLGLTPQSIYKFGTYAVRAQEEVEATKLKKDAKLLEKAGCFAIVLEKIPANLAKEVSDSIRIPFYWHWRRQILRWTSIGNA